MPESIKTHATKLPEAGIPPATALLDAGNLRPLLEPNDLTISLYLPMGPEERNGAAPEARLRNLIGAADTRLAQWGVDKRRRETLLAPAHYVADTTDFKSHRTPGLVLFLTGSGMQAFTSPVRVPELAAVGERLHLKPLLGFLAHNQRFYILALSGGEVRLFAATAFECTEIRLDYLPPEVQAELDSRLAADTAGPAADKARQALLLQDPHRIAEAVHAARGSDPAPVILAAEPRIIGHFPKQRVTHLHPEALQLNPFAIPAAELHRRALTLIRPAFEAPLAEVLDQAHARLGTAEPTVGVRLEEILEATFNGRVDAIIVAEDESLWGRFQPGEALHARKSPEGLDEELLNLAAVQTLRTGGRAFALPHVQIPRQSVAVALFRY
ncbi:MAG: hypothetical protein JOY71_18870 [Acetobacteraceae bacterium]|nr:hypothetical protein [Acetobacteraceae bacterium]MBV8590229.1 hypothetical protein [Acetobacteraceae bacterium]